jgi:hypothetical protein
MRITINSADKRKAYLFPSAKAVPMSTMLKTKSNVPGIVNG